MRIKLSILGISFVAACCVVSASESEKEAKVGEYNRLKSAYIELAMQ